MDFLEKLEKTVIDLCKNYGNADFGCDIGETYKIRWEVIEKIPKTAGDGFSLNVEKDSDLFRRLYVGSEWDPDDVSWDPEPLAKRYTSEEREKILLEVIKQVTIFAKKRKEKMETLEKESADLAALKKMFLEGKKIMEG